MNEDRQKVEAAAEFMRKAVNKTGFAARIETVNTMDAYFGSLPGHGVENVRRPLVNTLNLADLMPTSTIWYGRKQSPKSDVRSRRTTVNTLCYVREYAIQT